jgi:hypothetical protein
MRRPARGRGRAHAGQVLQLIDARTSAKEASAGLRILLV